MAPCAAIAVLQTSGPGDNSARIAASVLEAVSKAVRPDVRIVSLSASASSQAVNQALRNLLPTSKCTMFPRTPEYNNNNNNNRTSLNLAQGSSFTFLTNIYPVASSL
mmetsp:Transcript_10981/g.21597  ORF Transcript_10981/g.21597 Transcript_10981/m.21597 type:complete len:107 (-) Transcript_10981:39-359(-)